MEDEEMGRVSDVETVMREDTERAAVYVVIENVETQTPANEAKDSNSSEGDGKNNYSPNKCVEQSRQSDESGCKKRKLDSINDNKEDDLDDGKTCSICYDDWTSTGEHRVCCLNCGHVFGRRCIVQWLRQTKKCPQCNKPSNHTKIRNLYVNKLVATDNEKEQLTTEINLLKIENKKLETYLSSKHLALTELKEKLSRLEAHYSEEFDPGKEIKFFLDKNTKMEDGCCRVFAFNATSNSLYVSQKSSVGLFPGYGCKRISGVGLTYQPNSFILLHQKMIRDFVFNPSNTLLLLSVGFDKTARIYNFETNSVLKTYKAATPLWCCCWDLFDSNKFYVGCSNGVVIQYDVNSDEPVETLTPSIDSEPGPVISLIGIPSSFSRPHWMCGGIICCRLNCISIYVRQGDTTFKIHQLPLTGPFISMSYDCSTQYLLTSSRPNANNPQVRHVLSQVTNDDTVDVLSVREVHTFHGGPRQNLLSRSCFIRVNGRLLMAVFQETSASIEISDTGNFNKVQSISVPDAVLDLLEIKKQDSTYLAALTEKWIKFYRSQ